MNHAMVSGRVATSPSTSYIPIGDANVIACRFVVSMIDGEYDSDMIEESEDCIEFLECITFGEAARMLNNYFSKGVRIVCGGKLRNYGFKDANGTDHFTNILLVNYLEFAGQKPLPGKKKESILVDKMHIEETRLLDKAYKEFVDNGYLCVNEDDYYMLARGKNCNSMTF